LIKYRVLPPIAVLWILIIGIAAVMMLGTLMNGPASPEDPFKTFHVMGLRGSRDGK
jgi:hypothetical protein